MYYKNRYLGSSPIISFGIACIFIVEMHRYLIVKTEISAGRRACDTMCTHTSNLRYLDQ